MFWSTKKRQPQLAVMDELSRVTVGMNGKGQKYDYYAEALEQLNAAFELNHDFNKAAKMENEDELKQAEMDMKAILEKTKELAKPESD